MCNLVANLFLLDFALLKGVNPGRFGLKQFEGFRTITVRPLRTCPVCVKKELKRIIGAGAGIIFEGSGFYQIDYRSESYKKAEKRSTEKKRPLKAKRQRPAKKNKVGTDSKRKSA